MAKYTWIDQSGVQRGPINIAADCATLIASWSNEVAPKRILSCSDGGKSLAILAKNGGGKGITGSLIGGIIGGIGGLFGGGPECTFPKFEIAGVCVDPTAVLPGGDPFIGTAPGAVVEGIEGRPAIQSGTRQITRHTCPPGYILGRQNLCYWNLPRNSKLRKWRPGRRPLFTGGDLNAIARTRRLASRAEEIFKVTNPNKKAVSKSAASSRRRTGRPETVQGGTLRVLHEEN